MKTKLIAGLLSVSLFSGVSFADSSTWKKAAIGGAAVTTYGLVKGKGRVATVGGLVTAGSYLKYRSDKKKEAKEEARRIRWYKGRYGRSWRNYYRSGN